MARVNVETGNERLRQMREALHAAYGKDRDWSMWDPLIELAVYAEHPKTLPTIRAATIKEITKYVYPQLKAVEHSGEHQGLQVLLVNFSPRTDGNGQLGNEISNAHLIPAPQPAIGHETVDPIDGHPQGTRRDHLVHELDGDDS